MNKDLKNVALYLTLISAYLYLCGFSFYEGYLSVFHLNSEMFPVSIEKLMTAGFLAFSVRALKFYAIFAGIICGFLYFLMITVAFLKGDWLTEKHLALKKHFNKKNDGDKFKGNIYDRISTYAIVIAIPLFFFIVTLGSVQLSRDFGQNQAKDRLDKLNKTDYKITTTAKIKLPTEKETLIKGEIITYSSDFTALYANKSVKLITSKYIVSMDITPKEN